VSDMGRATSTGAGRDLELEQWPTATRLGANNFLSGREPDGPSVAGRRAAATPALASPWFRHESGGEINRGE
jgi:hypothetical protein